MAALVRHRFYLRGSEKGVRADLSFRNLTGLSLKKQDLRNIILKGANLAGVDFSGSDLSGADFFGADLECADLHEAILTGADFRGANLSRTILSSCNLQGADFSAGGISGSENAKLTDARLDHALLCRANLSGCDMSGAELADADLSGADLTSAVLVGAELSGATLDNVKLSNTVIELSRISASQRTQMGSIDGIVARTYEPISDDFLSEAIESHLLWIETGGQDGRRIDLDSNEITCSTFKGRNLSGARIRRCSMKGLDLANTVLDMADLTYTDLSDANLEGASLRGATLRGVDFSRSSLVRACVDYMEFVGTKSWPANLDRALLRDADLSNSSFKRALMGYSDISGSIITGADFQSVDFTKVKRAEGFPSVTPSDDRRISRRYDEPRIFVKSEHGVFYSVNWSLTGICLAYKEGSGFAVDSDVHAKILAEGHPPARSASFRVVKHDRHRGHVYLKFIHHNDEAFSYLKSIIHE